MPSELKRGVTACVLLSALGLGGCIAPRPAPPAAVSSPASATEENSWVVGAVFNRENGKVIPTATLTLYFQEIERTPRAPVRSKSNREGKFVLGPVTSGLYCLLATSFGYHSVAREFTLHRGKRDMVNIVLEPKAVQVSMQRCSPDRASIDMCPADERVTERTRCSGQP
jgi:hypothetical protein